MSGHVIGMSRCSHGLYGCGHWQWWVGKCQSNGPRITRTVSVPALIDMVPCSFCCCRREGGAVGEEGG